MIRTLPNRVFKSALGYLAQLAGRDDALRRDSDIIDRMQAALLVYRLDDPADDHSLRLVSTNPASIATLGLDAKTCIERRIDEIFPSLRAQGIPAIFAEVIRTGRPFEMPEFLYSESGRKPTWFSFKAAPLPDRCVAVLYEDINDRKNTEEALRQSESRLRTIFDTSHAGILLTDSHGLISFANQRMADLFHCPLSALIGTAYASHVHPEERVAAGGAMQQLTAGELSYVHYERHYLRSDGSDFWGYISSRPQLDPNGQVNSVVVIVIDVTEHKLADEKLRRSLQEKDVLIKEVHHRVKNNMQVISSLLQLQAYDVRDPLVQEALLESQRRIRSMALVHDKLYRSPHLDQINFAEYVKSLIETISDAFRQSSVRIELEIPEFSMDIDSAIPCGLIINELVSNCMKHAFPHNRIGLIRIEMKLAPSLADESPRFVLIVSDNGLGLPPDFDIRKVRTLGLRLVSSLAMQLRGEFSFSSANGSRFEMTFCPYTERAVPAPRVADIRH